MVKLRLDLQVIYERGKEIDFELNPILQEAIDKKIALARTVE